MDSAVHNIATREIIELMKNNVKNTDFQGENRVFVGIVSRLQYYTSCYIMNRTGHRILDNLLKLSLQLLGHGIVYKKRNWLWPRF